MILDVRERELIPLLPQWSTKQIPVGDIWIGLSGEEIQPGGVVAERKTVRDFEGSFLDGRYREQRARLLAFCAEKQLRPLYIIEGNLNSTRSLQKPAIIKLLSRLTLRYGISILQTANLNETAQLATSLAEQWHEDRTVFQGEAVKYAETISSSRKTNRLENLASAMLQQCPGISAKGAEALLDHFKTFPLLLQAAEKDIATIKVGTRKIGPVVAKRLWDLFHSDGGA